MNCKHLKIRTKKGIKYFYCSRCKKVTIIDNCKNCPYKEYKTRKPIKNRSNKLAKKELERFSIIYQDLSKCSLCGSKQAIELNEIYEGSYRPRSIKHGAVSPLCKTCHDYFHSNTLFNLTEKVKFQEEFLKTMDLQEFISIFGQDYRFKLEKTRKSKTKE